MLLGSLSPITRATTRVGPRLSSLALEIPAMPADSYVSAIAATELNAGRRGRRPDRATVTLAKFPHPYRAMMSICSDLDGTPDRTAYAEIARFLNTTHTTAMGPGVGLEVGNSLFFMMPSDQFSYFGTDEAGRDMARAMIRSGHIDCLHSYGDHARTRQDVERILAELDKHGSQLKVWVDHSRAPTNFGRDIMVGSGDVPTSAAYHADLTLGHGIRYVWRGRTTSITGQNVPVTARSLTRIFDLAHPIASTRTIAKQAVKVWLGRRSRPRWEMHARNRVCRPATLRDGRRVWEFMRSNPYWAGPGCGATAIHIGGVLSQRMLDTLIRTEGVCVLYTHLGKARDSQCPFDEAAQVAFRRLAALHRTGNILITTTHRLLRYLTVRDSVRFECSRIGERVAISITSIDDPVFGPYEPSAEDLMGLSFVTDPCDGVLVSFGRGQQMQDCDIVHHGEKAIASLKWQPLVFPEIDLDPLAKSTA